MDSLRILVAGSDKRSSTLGRMCARGFEHLGHEIRYFDTATQSVPVLGWTLGLSRMHDRFVETVADFRPDVVFVIGGNSLTQSTIETAARESGAVFCNWNPDNPFVSRSNPRRMETYLSSLPAYDLLFIWAKELFDALQNEGAEEVYQLQFAYDPTFHYPVNPVPEYEAEVVFVGHWSKKRQRYMRALLDLDVDLAIYGNYWRRKCFNIGLRRRVRDTGVFGDTYARVLASADVAINVVADHNLDACNMKTFEIPAIGVPMITSRTTYQESLFGDAGAAYFDSPACLKETVKMILKDDDYRRRMADVGRGTVKPHTYERKMKTVVEMVSEFR